MVELSELLIVPGDSFAKGTDKFNKAISQLHTDYEKVNVRHIQSYIVPENNLTSIELEVSVTSKNDFAINYGNTWQLSENYDLSSDNKSVIFKEPLIVGQRLEIIYYSGVLNFATLDEVSAGIVENKAISPKSLKNILSSYTTESDGVYQKNQGNSITWGNNDFSQIYGEIKGTTEGISISAARIDLPNNYFTTVDSPDGSISTRLYFKKPSGALDMWDNGAYIQLGMNPNKEVDFTMSYEPTDLVNPTRLILRGTKRQAELYAQNGLGINSEPDPLFTCNIKGNCLIAQANDNTAGDLVIRNTGNVARLLVYSGGEYVDILGHISNNPDMFMGLFITSTSLGFGARGNPYAFQFIPASGGHYFKTAGVGINTDPDSTYALKVEGDGYYNGNVTITGNLTVTGTINGTIA